MQRLRTRPLQLGKHDSGASHRTHDDGRRSIARADLAWPGVSAATSVAAARLWASAGHKLSCLTIDPGSGSPGPQKISKVLGASFYHT